MFGSAYWGTAYFGSYLGGSSSTAETSGIVKSVRVPESPVGSNLTSRIHHLLLLDGDMQETGTDYLLLEGDALDLENDALKLEGDVTALDATITHRASVVDGGIITKRMAAASVGGINTRRITGAAIGGRNTSRITAAVGGSRTQRMVGSAALSGTTITRRLLASASSGKAVRVPESPVGSNLTSRIHHLLLLDGDMQETGTDYLLLEGDALDLENDALKLEGEPTLIGGTVTGRLAALGITATSTKRVMETVN